LFLKIISTFYNLLILFFICFLIFFWKCVVQSFFIDTSNLQDKERKGKK